MEGIFIGPFLMRWNGILIMVGVMLAGVVATIEAHRRNHDPEIILDLALPIMFWGTLGARIWHVFTPSLSALQAGLTTKHYLTNLLDFFALWLGGFGFPGALLGGLFGLFLFCRKHSLEYGELADVLAPGLAFGQAVGRLGNYFNQELYGPPTDVAWKISISVEHRIAGHEAVEFYHPLFAYESLLSLLNFAILILLSRRSGHMLRNGDLFLVYLFNASLIRILLEFLRLDVSLVGGVNINQVAMTILGITACLIYWRRHLRSVKL